MGKSSLYQILFFSLLTLGLGACSKNSSQGAPPAVVFSNDSGGPNSAVCQAFIAKLPSDYIHGFVSVPENYQDSTSPQIQVFYYGKLISGQTPVVFFNGGPTSNSWGDFRVLYQRQQSNAIFAGLPFVYIDQRGTGCSDPYPPVRSYSDLGRLALYGSVGIVSDAEVIRKQLIGSSPWKVFGQSYGGMIVHRYIMMAPNSIVSATSHGFSLTVDPLETLTARIDSQKRVVDAYLKAYPQDQVALEQLNQLLTPTTCFSPTTGQGQICGKRVLSPFYSVLGFLDEWAWMHSWLAVLPDKAMQKWIDRVIFNPSVHKAPSQGWADDVIWHNEMVFAFQNTNNCNSVFRTLENKGEDPASWLLDECQAAMQYAEGGSRGDSEVAALPQNIIALSDFKNALAMHPQLKFYLYSGGLDPYSPVEIFKNELNSLGARALYSHFPNSGHDGFFSEDLVWQNLLKN